MADTAGVEQILHIIEQGGGGVNLSAGELDFAKPLEVESWLHVAEQLSPVSAKEHLALRRAIRDAEVDPHEETIELRFRKREGADLPLRVLRREDEERIW